MAEVTELRVALTVADFDRALAFYRDGLGLEQLADWSGPEGRVVLLEAGRATLELFEDFEAGGRRLIDCVRGSVSPHTSAAGGSVHPFLVGLPFRRSRQPPKTSRTPTAPAITRMATERVE